MGKSIWSLKQCIYFRMPFVHGKAQVKGRSGSLIPVLSLVIHTRLSTAPSATKNSSNTKGRVAEAEERWSKLAEKERQRIEKASEKIPIKFWKDLTRRIEACSPRFAAQNLETDGPNASYDQDGPPSLWSRQLNTSAPWQLSYVATINGSFPRFIPVACCAVRKGKAFLQNLAREVLWKVQENSRFARSCELRLLAQDREMLEGDPGVRQPAYLTSIPGDDLAICSGTCEGG
jgi:hypothetical protein